MLFHVTNCQIEDYLLIYIPKMSFSLLSIFNVLAFEKLLTAVITSSVDAPSGNDSQLVFQWIQIPGVSIIGTEIL